MSDETERKGVATVPPPDGADDPYSAATRVSSAPADLLAIVRDAEEARAKPEAKKMSDEESKTTEKPKSEPPPAPKPKSEPPPAPKAKPKSEPAPAPKAKPAAAAAKKADADQPSSPASAIITLFVLIAAALALATR